MSNPQQLVQKLWNYCNILRDDGLSYGDLASQARHELVARDSLFAARNVVVEQLTFLLVGSLAPARSGLRPSALQNPFHSHPSGSSLKMADEAFARGHQLPPFHKPSAVPKDYAWPSLLAQRLDINACKT